MADWIEDAEVKLDQSNTIAVANRHLINRTLNMGLLHNDSLLAMSAWGRFQPFKFLADPTLALGPLRIPDQERPHHELHQTTDQGLEGEVGDAKERNLRPNRAK